MAWSIGKGRQHHPELSCPYGLTPAWLLWLPPPEYGGVLGGEEGKKAPLKESQNTLKMPPPASFIRQTSPAHLRPQAPRDLGAKTARGSDGKEGRET